MANNSLPNDFDPSKIGIAFNAILNRVFLKKYNSDLRMNRCNYDGIYYKRLISNASGVYAAIWYGKYINKDTFCYASGFYSQTANGKKIIDNIFNDYEFDKLDMTKNPDAKEKFYMSICDAIPIYETRGNERSFSIYSGSPLDNINFVEYMTIVLRFILNSLAKSKEYIPISECDKLINISLGKLQVYVFEILKNAKCFDATVTDRSQYIKARVGQDKFRNSVASRWDSRCAVLDIDQKEILRASHIVAWSECNNRQRLDSENGILLSAHLDALFDKHLISFLDNGNICFSCRLCKDTIRKLSLHRKLKLRRKMTDRMKEYMSLHRQQI